MEKRTTGQQPSYQEALTYNHEVGHGNDAEEPKREAIGVRRAVFRIGACMKEVHDRHGKGKDSSCKNKEKHANRGDGMDDDRHKLADTSCHSQLKQLIGYDKNCVMISW